MNTGRNECDTSCRLGKCGFEWRGRKKKFWICSTERGKESVIKRRDESQDEETDGPNDTGNRTFKGSTPSNAQTNSIAINGDGNSEGVKTREGWQRGVDSKTV